MKQHLLPQFYLRGFTDPDTPPEHEPFVWVYSLQEQKWEKRSPKNVAAETDYYTFNDEDGKKSEDIEEMLQRIESGAASVINNKIANRKPLSDDDRIVIATFIASTMMRVPGQHDHIGDFLSEIGKKF